MIKFENTDIYGFEQAIRGMRNPMNSWSKSDSAESDWCNLDGTCPPYKIGESDMALMTKLVRAGDEHAKFMRMITVTVDITAPLYWIPEFDSYKVGVVKNSCSFMHKGTAKPYEITDFSVTDERIYEILSPRETKAYTLMYPYETDEWRPFTDVNGRTYRVYRNGRIIRESFEYTDNYGTGRHRIIPESNATVYQEKHGYFVVKLAGRTTEHVQLHRMVAEVWCDRPEGTTQVNHKDGNKGNNCAENLEWVTPKENVQHAYANGLYDSAKDLRSRYARWKNSSRVIKPKERASFLIDCKNGMTYKELAEKWCITPAQANNARSTMRYSENEELFQQCYVWERIIENLNNLRNLYLETGDEAMFRSIRCLMPQGYMQRSTVQMNYAVLRNIYRQRKNHRLPEWHDFCSWVETLPYAKELITIEGNKNES